MNINNISVTPDDGITGINIDAFGNGIKINGLNESYDAAIIQALGNGLKVDSARDSGRFTSSENRANLTKQAHYRLMDYEGLVINRQFTRPASGGGSTAKATGPFIICKRFNWRIRYWRFSFAAKARDKKIPSKIVLVKLFIHLDPESANSYLVDDGTGQEEAERE